MRNVKDEDVENIDVVIHLASLSNDPLGEFMPELTNEINYIATIKLAEIAKKKGVKKFCLHPLKVFMEFPKQIMSLKKIIALKIHHVLCNNKVES